MSTKYNIEIVPVPFRGLMPRDVYDFSVEQLNKAGLLGEKRVSHVGRVRDGYDPACNVHGTGEFGLFYRKNMDSTIREIVEDASIKTSGFDEIGMRRDEIGGEAVEIIEMTDPASQVLPWKIMLKAH